MLSKVSAADQAEVKAAYWDIFEAIDLGEDITPGQNLVRDVPDRPGREFVFLTRRP